MKRDWKYIAPLLITFVGIVLYQIYGSKPLDWKHSYSREDKIPYGNYLLYSNLKDIFPDKQIEFVEKTVFETLDTLSQHSNYLFINSRLTLSKQDVERLLGYITKGNHAFIASNDFGLLADTLKFAINEVLYYSEDKDTTGLPFQKDSIALRFLSNGDSNKYYFKTEGMYAYFDSLNANARKLAVNEQEKPVLIEVPFGRGSFYLSSTPLAFTNYNFLRNNNSEFIAGALSFLPLQNVLWDEYYQRMRKNTDTPLRFILSEEALKWAYFTALLSLLLFILFEARRRQRAIPVIVPAKNESLVFVQTIGKLYFFHKNNKSIADRKIVYFFEFVRTKFYLKTNLINADFIDSLSHKSGIEMTKVKRLIDYINQINKSERVSKENLQQLNKLIMDFHKNIKRSF